jgi:hypothetical protein
MNKPLRSDEFYAALFGANVARAIKATTKKQGLPIRNSQNWIPASGGLETPFKSRSGRTLLYCYQPSTGRHAYLDTSTDLILSNREAQREMS